MSVRSDAAAEAARRAAAEARRRAEEAARRAAQEAAKKAAQAAAQKTAQAAAQKAAQAKKLFAKDEVSQGLGRALRDRAASKLASPLPSPSAPSAPPAPGRTVSLSELRALQAKGGALPTQAATLPAAAGARAEDPRRQLGVAGATSASVNPSDPRQLGVAGASTTPGASRAEQRVTEGARQVAASYDAALRAGKSEAEAANAAAQKLPNESELMHLDDGFYEHADAGGQGHLMAALGARLEAHGKTEARDELLDRHEGLLGALGDAWDATGGRLVSAAGDFVGAVGDAAGAVVGFAGDVGQGALRVVGEAGEMTVDVAKGTVELAGNAADWTADQVRAAADYAAKNGLKLAGAALNWVGDHARDLAAEALDIDGQLAKLDSPGDSVTLAVGGSLGASSVQAGAQVEMTITKTEDGYEMTLSGEVSGGVFGGLGLPGFPSAEGEANLTGTASATMKFDSLDEVTQAAETVGGIGIAAAVGGPAGALLTGATAADEIRDIASAFDSGSVALELSAEATASLGETAGLGAGGEISGAITTGVRIDITKGQPPALVLEQSIEASGSLSLGAPVEIPSLGGALNGGSLDGSASISTETSVPLPPGFSVTDLAKDPVGAMKNVGQHALDNATTTVSMDVDVHAGLATEDLPLNLGSDGGLEIELSGEARTKDIVGALATALRGDLGGALEQLGTKTELDVSVSSYTESGFDIDEEISAGGFKIGIHAENSRRDETELWSFEGTPAELARQGFTLFQSLQLNVS